MSLTRQVDVLAVAATADDQARVLLAEDVLAYALRRGSGSRLKKRHGVSPSRSRAVTPEHRGHDRGEIPGDERRVVRIARELWISLGVSVNGTGRRSARGCQEPAAALQDDRLATPARDMLASLRTHFGGGETLPWITATTSTWCSSADPTGSFSSRSTGRKCSTPPMTGCTGS